MAARRRNAEGVGAAGLGQLSDGHFAHALLILCLGAAGRGEIGRGTAAVLGPGRHAQGIGEHIKGQACLQETFPAPLLHPFLEFHADIPVQRHAGLEAVDGFAAADRPAFADVAAETDDIPVPDKGETVSVAKTHGRQQVEFDPGAADGPDGTDAFSDGFGRIGAGPVPPASAVEVQLRIAPLESFLQIR